MPRYLGQHFLKDKTKIRQTVSAVNPEDGDFIIEVGPGHGELTSEILKIDKDFRLLLVEKDKKLASLLKTKFSSENRLEIIEGDILKTLPSLIKKSPYKICGNIPYYLTGFLFRKIGELSVLPKLVVFTIQKEVGERLSAKKGDFNLLAASIQLWGKPKIITSIPKKSFSPPPKVDSVTIFIEKKDHLLSESEKSSYFLISKAAFKQPRKTLLNNLSAGLDIEKVKALNLIKKIGLLPDSRPQDLDFDSLFKLSRLI
ncbi:MAG: 16S rRNA (adenine(1518)-N(6)/adenine(1519)-N(6))-dimethyltransferase RsmA [Candidatus Pacebacteria bacterium]|nr:16S rRNA (adenine(1518)-N(6)/adenine(1519)-N(6))-dimethyltransferase RsmA [Candidatus Paceibacterota bacterium]